MSSFLHFARTAPSKYVMASVVIAGIITLTVGVLLSTVVSAHTEDDEGNAELCHSDSATDKGFHHYYYKRPGAVSVTIPTHYDIEYHNCSSPTIVSRTISPAIPGMTFSGSNLSGTLAVGTYNTTLTLTFDPPVSGHIQRTATTGVTIVVSNGITVGAISDVTVTENQQSTISVNPTVTGSWGSSGSWTYSVTNGGVNGLTGSAGSSKSTSITGTPVGPGTYTATYTARHTVPWKTYQEHYDDEGDNYWRSETTWSSGTAIKNFDIYVDGTPVFSPSASISDKAYQNGSSIAASMLPAATGGNGSISYSLSGAPAGISVHSSTRIMTGTPTETGDFTVTYTATDDDGSTDTITFAITVTAAPPTPTPVPTATPWPTPTNSPTAASFGSQSVASQGYIKDSAITNLVLPAAASGTGSKNYRLSPSVPGLTFTTSTRTLSGTPTALGAHNMAYTVSNSGGSDTLNFSITVSAADTAPTFGSSTVSDQLFGKDVGINTLQLPAGSGGNGALTYSLSALPSGLSFDAATRLVTGAPDTLGETAMTYTVSDVDSNTETTDSDSLTFSIDVEIADIALTGFASSVATQVYEEGVQISALQLPRADGGNVPVTYELTPSVPGLSFDAFTRRLTGTPTTAGTHDMSYTATDSKDVPESVTATFTITVQPPDIDPVLDGAISEQLYDTLTDITAWVLPEGSAGNGPLVYALTPVINGLNFDGATRQLSGRASMVGIYAMTYTVTDYDGDTASLNFSITVEPGDTSPDHFDSAVARQVYDVGSDVGIITLPSVVGGNPPFIYSLKPRLPGLTFYAATHQITGSPTVAGNHVMTYQVVDVDGDAHSMLFIIRVNGVPTFDGELSDLVYEDGVAVGTLALPEAVGGNLPVTYELTPQVPGLSFNAESREITGTPTAAGSYGMKYQAVDHDGDSDVVAFTITVNESDTPPVFGSNMPTTFTFKLGKEMVPAQLGLAEGGNGELRYSWAPAVPGLRLEPTTGELTGTPTQEGTVETVLTATDEDGDSGTVTCRIEVTPFLVQPAFTLDSVDWSIGESAEGYDLVGGVPVVATATDRLSYSLGGDHGGHFVVRPDGQVQIAATARIDYETQGVYSFTLEVRNSLDVYGETDDVVDDWVMVTVSVADENENAFGVRFELGSRGRGVRSQHYWLGVPIEPLQLPEATGGKGDLRYRLHPVPPGLNFNESNLWLTGTPDYEFDNIVTLTAGDGALGEGRGDYAEISFRVKVSRQVQRPEFGAWAELSDQVYVLNRKIESLPLPVANGGDEPLEYQLRPRVPGLHFDGVRRELSGTPEVADTFAMRYVVLDRDGDLAALAFQVSVVTDEQFVSMYAPGEPTGLVASTVGDNSVPAVVLIWRAPSGEGNGAVEHYEVQRSGNRLVWQAIAEVNGVVGENEYGYADEEVKLREEWSYRVVAVNENGMSGPSEMVSVLVGSDSQVVGGLQPPVGLNYLVNETAVRVSWGESGQGNAYQLDVWHVGQSEWAPYGGGQLLSERTVDLPCCDDEDPIPEWVRVRTVQVHGPEDQSESGWSGSLRIYTEEQLIGELLAPAGLDAVVEHGLIQLRWRGIPNMDGYQVEERETVVGNGVWQGVDHGAAGFVLTNRILVPCCYAEELYGYEFRARSVLISRDGWANYSDWSEPIAVDVDRRPQLVPGEDPTVASGAAATVESGQEVSAGTGGVIGSGTVGFVALLGEGNLVDQDDLISGEGASFLGMDMASLGGILVLGLAVALGAGIAIIYLRRRSEREGQVNPRSRFDGIDDGDGDGSYFADFAER